MTRQEVEEIVLKRLDKVIEDANKEFAKEWEITANNCCGDTFEVTVDAYCRTIEEYTKEELVEMIKKVLLDIKHREISYNTIYRDLRSKEYVAKNEEALKKITFEMSLITAKNYITQLKVPLSEIRKSLCCYDKEFFRKFSHFDYKAIDPIRFLNGKEYDEKLENECRDTDQAK